MDLFENVPDFSPEAAAEVARERYALEATAEPLASERDQNFLLTTAAGGRFVLKVANALEEPGLLEAQDRMCAHAASRGVDFCPVVVEDREGRRVSVLSAPGGAEHYLRLLSYLPGTPLARVPRRTEALLVDLGRKLGRLDRALEDFDHPAAHRDFPWDLSRGPAVVEEHRHLLGDDPLGAFVDRAVQEFRRHAAPRLGEARRSVIHGDANDHNVLVGDGRVGGGEDLYSRNQTVTGLIDFGDLVYSHTAGNLAVGAAYAVLDRPDPLAAAAAMVRGYHEAFPLTGDEIAALFGLIQLRLAVSASMAMVQRAARPDDPYLAVSQEPIRRTLPLLAEVPYGLAHAVLRRAAGREPVPGGRRIAARVRELNTLPVLGGEAGAAMKRGEIRKVDLGMSSPLVEGDPASIDTTALSARIEAELAAVLGGGAGAGVGTEPAVGWGAYNEVRVLYAGEVFEGGPGLRGESRTVHLGVDLFAPTGTPVCAPLDGEVSAVGYFPEGQDYGGAVLLAHRLDGGEDEPDELYTLYGHLSRESVEGLKVGRKVAAGEELGRLGDAAENGGWPPHLHFQLVLDPLGWGAAFPGVGAVSRREVWQALSPDPSLLTGVRGPEGAAADDTYAGTLAGRRARWGGNLSLGYREPLKIERGWRQYLWDHRGRRYLDAYNNVPHVGHCHPKVVEAGRRQMGILNTNTRYLHDLQGRYAERLAATLPAPLEVCYFVNSASEANELALRLARACTGRQGIVVLEGAYHGHTTSLIDISPYKHDGPGGAGAPDWVHTAPLADVYRGPYKASDPEAGRKYAAAVGEIVEEAVAAGRPPAAFIAESCPSVGGQILFPPGYLEAVYAHVRAAGALAIADEVQTGYGRLGSSFYGFQLQDVVPDIVVLGKPIGNGHPIAAVVTTSAVAEAFDNGMEFFSTFGGNTVSCAVGLAVLEVVEEEGLQAHAHRVGGRLLDGLRPLGDRHSIVGDVRGSGLFLGVELVRDRDTLEPAAAEASFVVNRLCEEGILAGTDGPLHNVVKIRPPMPFDESDADRLVRTFEEILSTSLNSPLPNP